MRRRRATGAAEPSPALRALADTALRWSPAQPLFARRAARRLAVLGYHAVEDPERFERHLDFLARRMRPVSLEEVVTALERGRSLPDRAVLVTFDDADRTVVRDAMPLLRGRSVPAVAFVVAGLLDGDRPVWTAEVRELVGRGAVAAGLPRRGPRDSARFLKALPEEERGRLLEELRGSVGGLRAAAPQLRADDLPVLESAGIAVGNHTFGHPPLPTCPNDRLTAEIVEAHRVLAEACGRLPVAFAFPEGFPDPRADRVLRDVGYRVAFIFDHALAPFPPRDPYRFSRLRVDSDVSLDRLRVVISGLHPAVHAARLGGSRAERVPGLPAS
jgi:peptidoglycan/xylan/chitin deacetylase (PgdA/CDA1 family)